MAAPKAIRMIQKKLDNKTSSVLACGQVAFNPRVNWWNLTETQVFLCPTDERTVGCGGNTIPACRENPRRSSSRLKTPGDLQIATLQKNWRSTMNTARQASALSDTHKVVSMDKYRPPVTAEQLIIEATHYQESPGSSLEESTPLLPSTFACILELILEDFDYRNNKLANTAIACRILAASHNHYEEILSEMMQ